jgi:phage gp29-like protein
MIRKTRRNRSTFLSFADKQAPGKPPSAASAGDRSALASLFSRMPNPDPILKKAGKDITAYRELLFDSRTWSAVQSWKSGVKALEFELYSDQTDETRLDELNAWQRTLDLNRIFSEMLDARLYGYQPMEIMWQTVAGKWIPLDIQGKPAEWFEFNKKGELCIKPQFYLPAEIKEAKPVETYSYLLPRHYPSADNPYGQAVLARCFWPVSFRRGGKKFFATFTEKYGMPHAIGKQPRGTATSDQNELLKQLENMVQDAVAVIPDDSSIEIMQTGKGESASIYKDFLTYADEEIQMVLLSASLAGGTGNGGGSYALGKVHDGIREDVIMEGVRIIEQQMNQLLQWIQQFNYGGGDVRFRMYQPEDVDKTLAERDEILTRTGVSFTKKYFTAKYGLDEDEFEVTAQPAAPAQPPAFAQTHCSCAQCAGKTAHFAQVDADEVPAGQKIVDDIIETADSEQAVKQALQPVLAVFNEAGTFEEALEKLAALYPELDASMLEDKLTRAFFLAEVIGRSETQ